MARAEYKRSETRGGGFWGGFESGWVVYPGLGIDGDAWGRGVGGEVDVIELIKGPANCVGDKEEWLRWWHSHSDFL